MGWDWDIPKWQKEGRTGPGPVAPRYANRKDRNAVRRGKPVGKNKGGGGQPTNGPYTWGNGPQPKSKCPCMEAVPALRRGKVRLAARLLRIGFKLRTGRMVWDA